MPGEHFPPLPLQDEGSLLGYLTQWYSKQTSKKGLGVIVAADDTPEDQKHQAQFVCTGRDDSIKINEAIDSLPSSGGEITLLAGTYYLAEDDGASGYLFDMAGKDNVTLRGEGREITILQPPGTRTTVIKWFTSTSAGVTSFTLSDLTLNGLETSYENNYADIPINFNHADNQFLRFERLLVTNWDDTGGTGDTCIDLAGSDSLWADCYFINNHSKGLRITSDVSRVLSCLFDTNGNVTQDIGALYVGGGSGLGQVVAFNTFRVSGYLDVSDGAIRILGNYFISDLSYANNGRKAIKASTSNPGTIIMGNVVTGTGWENGISSAGPAVVQGNTVIGVSRSGIALGGDDCLVADNVVTGCSQVTDDIWDGISVLGDRNNVQGNTVRHGGGAQQHRYGIDVGSGTDNWVTNNDLKNSGKTSSFNDSGTSTITVAGNRL